jgi:hypothetical protein
MALVLIHLGWFLSRKILAKYFNGGGRETAENPVTG